MPSPAAGRWDLDGALAAWGDLWRSGRWQRQDVRVVLSDAWLQVLALELPLGLQSEGDVIQFIQAELKQRTGKPAGFWHVDWTRIGKGILAVACPAHLLDSLRTTLAATQSTLAYASAQSLEQLGGTDRAPRSPGWWAVVSPATLTLACFEEQQLAGYWNHPCEQLEPDDLLMRLQRHHALLAGSLKKIDVVDPLRLLDSKDLTHRLQMAGWKAQVRAAPSAGPGKGLSDWTQFVAAEFS